MAREECKRDKLRIEAGVRRLKFEEKIRSNVNQKLFIACWKEISKQERETSRWTEMRRDYYRRCGWSIVEVENMRNAALDVIGEMKKRDKTVLEQK